MKIHFCLRRRLGWLNVPSTIIIALLQRTPAVKMMPLSGEMVMASPLGTVLRSAFVGVASLGGIHTMAGATELGSSQPSPASATVGTSFTVVFAIAGTLSEPESWTTGGTVPPGLSFGSRDSAVLTLSGTPTTAGSYVVTLQAHDAGTGNSTPTYSYTINVTAGGSFTAPAITTQPQSQSVTIGGSVSFTTAASGSPTPTYQWRKDGNPIGGATSATLALTNVQAGDAGIYTVVATNSAGSATSNGAVLTVTAGVVAPAITTHPQSQTVTSGGNATFTVAASGNPAPTYQWRKDGTPINGATSATLTLTNVQTGDAGTYTVVATNSLGSATSSGAVLTVTAGAGAPTITSQPHSQVVAPSSSFTLSVTAAGQSPFTYQWYKDGSVIPGATATTYSVVGVTTAHAGSYTVVVTSALGSVTSMPAVVGVGTPVPGRLANLSVRAVAGADAQTLIVGLIVGGGSKQVVLRGLGPTLALPPFNLPGTLPDPKLQVFGATAGLPSNENWGDGNSGNVLGAMFNAIGAHPLDPASKDAGILTTLASGDYTAWVTGAPGSSGIALAEIFDTEAPTSAGYLANISARAHVGTGDNILIVGFIISGNVPKQLLIRAIGPALAGAPYNVAGALADSRLDLYPAGASVPSASNDNWADNGAASSLSAAFSVTGAAPLTVSTSKDAVLLVTLQPGAYTALVSGVNGATGVALMELFQMP